MNKNIIGALLVSMAASAAFSADAAPVAKTATKAIMLCQNNSCKGKADCMGFGNDSCKGSNECKGHGTLNAKNKTECVKKHGKWTASK